jgi:hypothetical protein
MTTILGTQPSMPAYFNRYCGTTVKLTPRRSSSHELALLGYPSLTLRKAEQSVCLLRQLRSNFTRTEGTEAEQ